MDTPQFQNKKLPFLEFILIIYLFALYLIPTISMGSTTLLILLLAYCGYLLFMDRPLANMVIGTLILIFFLAFFYALLTDAASIAQDAGNREIKRFISKTYQYLTFYLPAILFVRINKTASQKQKRWILIAGLGMMVYVIISTWIYLIQHPGATKTIESFGGDAENDVANYYFIYAIPLMLATLATYAQQTTGIKKVLSWVGIVLGVIFLVNSQYTIALLITVVGVLIQLLRSMRSKSGKILLTFAFVVGALFLPQILQFAITLIPSEDVATRLSEVLGFFTGQGMDTQNLGGRMSLYGRTVVAFFQSPIWGNRYLGFDGHATFLTVLADTGILGGIPFYVLLCTTYKKVKSKLSQSRINYKVVLIMFVLMGLTNPIHAAMPLGLALWLLAPMTLQAIMKEDISYEKALEN